MPECMHTNQWFAMVRGEVHKHLATWGMKYETQCCGVIWLWEGVMERGGGVDEVGGGSPSVSMDVSHPPAGV